MSADSTVADCNCEPANHAVNYKTNRHVALAATWMYPVEISQYTVETIDSIADTAKIKKVNFLYNYSNAG